MLVARIADAVKEARPPGPLYGLVLEYGLGGLYGYITPLYEVTRVALIEAGKASSGLWDPSWAQFFGLPPGVPEEVPDRDLDITFSEDPELRGAFERYRGEQADSEQAYEAIKCLWRDVAVQLTRFDWKGQVDVTGDFVALAYPTEPAWFEVRRALRNSLGAERFQEFEAKGWIPEQLGPEPSDPR